MKLKKYTEYIKEELTPMAGELEEIAAEENTVETPIEEIVDVVSTEEEEEGHNLDSWKGDELLQQFAEMVGAEVVDNHVKVGDSIVSFGSETNTFLIENEVDKKRRNTKISDPHELVHKEFKGHEHNH